MFYTDSLLSKKGKLAKVWLAAHWERKLSKSQFLQTDLPASVESIIQTGQQPLALRLSGQLLLGVTRIYSRKARYLLEDCNEAFVKIKMAFKPGMVDMPGDHTIANLNAITLNDAITEFDILLPEPAFDMRMFGLPETGASQSLSRTQDITLAVPSQKTFQAAHDELNDMFGLDTNPSADADAEWSLDLGFGDPVRTPQKTAENPLEEDSMEVERGRDAVSQRGFSPRRDSLSMEEGGPSVDKSLDDSNNAMSMDVPEEFDMQAAADTLRTAFVDPMDIDDMQMPIQMDEDAGEMERTAGGGVDEYREGSPVAAPEPNFQPLETVAARGRREDAENQEAAPKKPQSKKRKLAIDSQTELPSHLIQLQLRDTSDILLDRVRYVPATRKMQRLMDNRARGALYSLLHARNVGRPAEFDILTRNAFPRRKAIPVSATSNHADPLYEQDVNLPSLDDTLGLESLEVYLPDAQPQDEENHLDLPDLPTVDDASILPTLPSPAPEDPSRIEEDGGFLLPDDINDLNNNNSTVDASVDAPGSARPEDEEDHVLLPDVDERDLPAPRLETTGADTLELLREGLEDGKSLSFVKATRTAKRADAVRLFFDLLVLSTKDVVSVKQDQPYEDIQVMAKDSLWNEIAAAPTITV
ncbi:sister chromatid cohesion protein 1 [Thoreauomyces humboldtii]|nr:sister chromatid cohesion protein 1 [Thoreauomyces humboldtii]